MHSRGNRYTLTPTQPHQVPPEAHSSAHVTSNRPTNACRPLCGQFFPSVMSHLSPSSPRLQVSERITQESPSRECQRWRYATFRCVHQPVNKAVTDRRSHSSTSSTMTRFSTYF